MKNLIKFLVKWNELLTIPFALLLWAFSPFILRILDPTAATYDGGVFQIILFAIIAFLILHGVAWLVLKITFPKLYKYLDDGLENDFETSYNKITIWEKIKIVLWLFTLYLFCLVLLCRVL